MKYIIGIIAFFTVFTVAVVLLVPNANTGSTAADGSNVKIENGVQIIDLTAKGGYEPRKTVAKAGVPTTLRVNTNGTFDCSSSITIPSLRMNAQLSPSGTQDFDLGSPEVGSMQGTCGMGMYRFEIDFQS